MKPAAERCTIVITGAWNQAIFSPAWVGKVAALSVEPRLDLLFGPGGVAYKIDMTGMWLEVLPHQLLIAPARFEDQIFLTMESLAVDILTRLKETPVRAVGINFGFDVPDASKTFDELFQPSDSRFLAVANAHIDSTTITRRLRVDGLTLNLSARRDSGAPRLDFNYHHVVASADEAKTTIGARVLELKSRTLQFAKTIYGLTLEGT